MIDQLINRLTQKNAKYSLVGDDFQFNFIIIK